MIEINLHLFGKPSWELELEGETPNFETIKAKGEELKIRLAHTAEIGETLLKAGWGCYGGLYDITFYKDVNLEEAVKETEQLGLAEELKLTEENVIAMEEE